MGVQALLCADQVGGRHACLRAPRQRNPQALQDWVSNSPSSVSPQGSARVDSSRRRLEQRVRCAGRVGRQRISPLQGGTNV